MAPSDSLKAVTSTKYIQFCDSYICICYEYVRHSHKNKERVTFDTKIKFILLPIFEIWLLVYYDLKKLLWMCDFEKSAFKYYVLF